MIDERRGILQAILSAFVRMPEKLKSEASALWFQWKQVRHCFSLYNSKTGTLYIEPILKFMRAWLSAMFQKEWTYGKSYHGQEATNMRSSGNDENIILTPPHKVTLEGYFRNYARR